MVIAGAFVHTTWMSMSLILWTGQVPQGAMPGPGPGVSPSLLHVGDRLLDGAVGGVLAIANRVEHLAVADPRGDVRERRQAHATDHDHERDGEDQ